MSAEEPNEEFARRNRAVLDSFNRNYEHARLLERLNAPPSKYEADKEVSGRARSFGKRMVEVLCDIAENECAKNSDRIKAAIAVLNRGFGTPRQTIDLTAIAGVENKVTVGSGMKGLLDAMDKMETKEFERYEDDEEELVVYRPPKIESDDPAFW